SPVRLAEQADPEAEDLRVIVGALDDREAEVERDRHRAEHRHDDAQAEAGGDAVVLDVDVALDRAGIDEGDGIEPVVGPDPDLVLEAVEELEVAAHGLAVDERADAAELEAADRAEAAGEEALEHRGVAAGPRNLRTGGQHLLAGAVGPLPDREEPA